MIGGGEEGKGEVGKDKKKGKGGLGNGVGCLNCEDILNEFIL